MGDRNEEQLRKVPLRFPDLCAQLFDGLISTATCLSQTAAMWPAVQVPADLPLVQPATAPKAIETKVEVPPEMPQEQPATAHEAMETEAEVPTELPKVQPACASEAMESKPEEPVQPAKTGAGGAFLGPVRQVVLNSPSFHPPDQTAPDVDQALTRPEPGEIVNEPLVAPSAERSPPGAPVEPQKEPMACSSSVKVPPELPQVHAASELVSIGTKRSISVIEEEILGLLKMIADKINKSQPPSKPTFEDCETKLNELGWRKDDPLHLVALTIFCDENDNYRELWMKLNPILCADWVRMIGRSKRFT